MVSNETEARTARLDTTEIRRMAAANVRDKRRRKEAPGAVLLWTVPGLCDEVDRLRAKVARIEAFHFQDGDRCRGDGCAWPCPTIFELMVPE